jgi:pimeloyl-ACP methyl ester carboxylesterase
MPYIAPIVAEGHMIDKLPGVRLFLWNKRHAAAGTPAGHVLFVHGSSMAAQPCFDLQVNGRNDYSVMDMFASLGWDTWCLDCEGYGRSDKHRDRVFDIADGADDLDVATAFILEKTGAGSLCIYGGSSGALRAALFAQRRPERVGRLALDAFVWTGEGSPTLAERRKRLPSFLAQKRRPLDAAFIQTIFDRDHPGSGDPEVIAAFARAVTELDDSIPNGTYIDMCSNLPIVDPLQVTAPTLIMRGQWDGIASFEDVAAFFARLPNPDKQLTVMPGVAHSSFHGKNHEIAKHILLSFFTQPAPVYTGSH